MTYVPGISQAYTSQAQGQTAEASDTLGQEAFLTLLVAQLQNQDPLNPSDPTEFTSQLAQYSELEQLFNLNDSMEALADAENNSERLSALSLIGKEILVQGADFHLGADGANIGYQVDGEASNIQLIIQDSSGTAVRTLYPTELNSGNHLIHWDGLDNEGNPLPQGSYSIVIQAQSASSDDPVGVLPMVRTEVTGVDMSGSQAILVTEDGEFKIQAIHGAYDIRAGAENGAEDEADAVSEIIDEAVSEATDGEGVAQESGA